MSGLSAKNTGVAVFQGSYTLEGAVMQMEGKSISQLARGMDPSGAEQLKRIEKNFANNPDLDQAVAASHDARFDKSYLNIYRRDPINPATIRMFSLEIPGADRRALEKIMTKLDLNVKPLAAGSGETFYEVSFLKRNSLANPSGTSSLINIGKLPALISDALDSEVSFKYSAPHAIKGEDQGDKVLAPEIIRRPLISSDTSYKAVELPFPVTIGVTDRIVFQSSPIAGPQSAKRAVPALFTTEEEAIKDLIYAHHMQKERICRENDAFSSQAGDGRWIEVSSRKDNFLDQAAPDKEFESEFERAPSTIKDQVVAKSSGIEKEARALSAKTPASVKKIAASIQASSAPAVIGREAQLDREPIKRIIRAVSKKAAGKEWRTDINASSQAIKDAAAKFLKFPRAERRGASVLMHKTKSSVTKKESAQGEKVSPQRKKHVGMLGRMIDARVSSPSSPLRRYRRKAIALTKKGDRKTGQVRLKSERNGGIGNKVSARNAQETGAARPAPIYRRFLRTIMRWEQGIYAGYRSIAEFKTRFSKGALAALEELSVCLKRVHARWEDSRLVKLFKRARFTIKFELRNFFRSAKHAQLNDRRKAAEKRGVKKKGVRVKLKRSVKRSAQRRILLRPGRGSFKRRYAIGRQKGKIISRHQKSTERQEELAMHQLVWLLMQQGNKKKKLRNVRAYLMDTTPLSEGDIRLFEKILGYETPQREGKTAHQ